MDLTSLHRDIKRLHQRIRASRTHAKYVAACRELHSIRWALAWARRAGR